MTASYSPATEEMIIEFYLASPETAMRCFGVARNLNAELYQTRGAMEVMMSKGILYRQSGYWGMNPPHLWRDEHLAEQYGERAEARLMIGVNNFLGSLKEMELIE